MTTATANGIDIDSIPAELVRLRQWVLWRSVTRNQRPTKVPYQPNGLRAASDNPKTWNDFDEVVGVYRGGKFDGIGFVFAGSDPFCGIDLDACRNPTTGELTPWAQRIVDDIGSYCEVSPSTEGVKITCRAKWSSDNHVKKLKDVPTFGDSHKPEVAGYDQKRFWTFTGWRLDDAPTEPQDRQPAVDDLCRRLWQPSKPTSQNTNGSTSSVHAAALSDMLRLSIQDGNDGSHRLFCAACRAVEHDLTDQHAINTVREYERRRPFPVPWTDADIVRRLRDAERKQERGKHAKPLTDYGNAERFVEQHGADVRFCYKWNKWLVWDSCRCSCPLSRSGRRM